MFSAFMEAKLENTKESKKKGEKGERKNVQTLPYVPMLQHPIGLSDKILDIGAHK